MEFLLCQPEHELIAFKPDCIILYLAIKVLGFISVDFCQFKIQHNLHAAHFIYFVADCAFIHDSDFGTLFLSRCRCQLLSVMLFPLPSILYPAHTPISCSNAVPGALSDRVLACKKAERCKTSARGKLCLRILDFNSFSGPVSIKVAGSA